MSIHLSEEAIYASVDNQLQSLGIQDVKARDLVDVTSDYVELGFSQSTKEELGNSSLYFSPQYCNKLEHSHSVIIYQGVVFLNNNVVKNPYIVIH